MTRTNGDTRRFGPVNGRRALCWAVLVGLAATLAACNSVEIQNRQPLAEVRQESRPPGTVYAGWRVFQDKCARCHGLSGTGTPDAPNLLPFVREMGPNRFVSLVLKRYDWNLPPNEAVATGDAHEALINETVEGKGVAIVMPAWQGEPRVTAHIMDLYAYLSARAEGTQGPGRPLP